MTARPVVRSLLLMARFSSFLGRAVEVQYRAGDVCLPASGIFVADSGRSIFLEQSFEQHGKTRSFRWELPYQCILRIEEKQDALAAAAGVSAPQATSPTAQSRRTAAEEGADSRSILSTRPAPKTD